MSRILMRQVISITSSSQDSSSTVQRRKKLEWYSEVFEEQMNNCRTCYIIC